MDKKVIVGIMCFILIWLSYLLQINFLNEFELFGVRPNIAIVVTTGIALLSGKIPGMLVGISYGLIYDVMFGKSIGLYILLYGLLGFLLGRYSNGFSKDNKLAVVYMVAVSTLITETINYLVSMILYGYSFELLAPILILIKETIYNMILARLLYGVFSSISEIINKCKNSYYLL